MNRNMRRILAAGVSLGALTASPAFADHVPATDGTVAGSVEEDNTSASITETLDITTADGFSGDVDRTAGLPATAVSVTSEASGQFGQAYDAAGGTATDATVDATITAGEDVNILAYAAVTTSGAANAIISAGVFQDLTGDDGATGSITNSAAMGIYATAIANPASATTLPNNVTADANIVSGVSQVVSASDGAASASFANAEDASLLITANAEARANTQATAEALVGTAILQTVVGDSASADLANAGAIEISAGAVAAAASATATATDIANANAQINNGIRLSANAMAGSGPAAASFANDGSVSVLASADAEADEATATAGSSYAASLMAMGEAATATFANNADATFAAAVNANATGSDAGVTGNLQDVFGVLAQAGSDDAVASLTNDGAISLTVAAGADSTAESGAGANATGGVARAVNVTAGANGDGNAAAASFSNAGSFTVDIDSVAEADEANAVANANSFDNLVSVSGTGNAGADANASVTNDGTFTLTLDAKATGTSTAEANASGPAAAFYVDSGSTNGDAVAALTNNGSLTFAYAADAAANSAEATAAAGEAFIVSATGSVSGIDLADASASVVNAASATMGVDAKASAAGEAGADADARAFGGMVSANSDNGDAIATLQNDGALSLTAVATAMSTNAEGTANDAAANASIGTLGYSFDVDAQATDEGNGTATFANSGSVDVSASASAVADDAAQANATARGARVNATANDDPDKLALASFDNAGTITVSGDAAAEGDSAEATARGFSLAAMNASAVAVSDPSGGATAEFVNGSDAEATYTLNAAADAADGNAAANANIASTPLGVIVATADADDNNALSNVQNDGAIDVVVTGTANAVEGNADANARINSVVYQSANLDVNADDDFSSTVSLSNGGTISADISAVATAADDDSTANETAMAMAALGGTGNQAGIFQTAQGSTVTLDNAGTIDFAVSANATGEEAAQAFTVADGIDQFAGGEEASVSLNNAENAVISVTGAAVATADEANAATFTRGVGQSASATTASVAFSNAGTFTAAGTATANGAATNTGTGLGAFAYADVEGVNQSLNGDEQTAVFANSGTFNVTALANATNTDTEATAGAAFAVAEGYTVEDDFALDVTNSGTMNVSAEANGVAAGRARATAIQAVATGDAATGTIVNDGTISAMATVTGGLGQEVGTGTTVQNVGVDTAIARGIHVNGAENTATVTNNGTISVVATNDGAGTTDAIITEAANSFPFDGPAYAPAAATGILFTGGTGTTGTAPTGTAVINNSGVITAQLVNDGVIEFGTAINVENAPNAVQVNLLGGGNIYGNIELSDDDAITVSGGETSFEGIVNSDGVLDGSLTIAEDGTLYLRDNRETATDVPAALVNVEDFTVDAGGTLALDLVDGDADPAYPQVVADTADITDGVLEVRVADPDSLLANSYSYDNIIDANTLTGTFADVVTPNLFLDATAVYDTDDNVDLTVARVAFDDSGFALGTNPASVAGGLETIYDPTGNGDMDDLYIALFGVDNVADYSDALSQLSGSQYATYLQSLSWMGNRFNGILADMGECAALNTDAGMLTCKRHGPGIWGTVNYGAENIDADSSIGAPGYDSDQWYAALGADMPLGEYGVIGIGAGYVKNKGNFEGTAGNLSADMDADGFQVGAYAAYDPGNFYAKASGSYSEIKGDSTRSISIGDFGGALTSSPKASIWALGGEVGYRLPVGKAVTLTPYAGLDYVSAEYDTFTESGLPGANLTVDGKDSYATSELGVKLQGTMGAIQPELKVGWRHSFEEDPAYITAAFADAPGTAFNIYGPDRNQDAIVAGAKVAGQVGESTWLELGYEGWMASKQDVHSGFITLRHEFGAAPAAVAPP
ncbi:autotransporter domain-containing protein, partial [Altericroceibacterium endophyticum]